MRVAARIEDQYTTLKKVVAALTGRIDIFDNIDCVIVDVADTGVAGVAFTVNHNLGRVPTVYICNIASNGVVYDSSRATWTISAMTLKCSVNNAVLKLVIL